MSFAIENNILKGAVQPIDVDHKLGELIYDALSENPDHVAQIDADTDEKTSCGEMKDRSVRCALWMKKFGVGPDDIVVVVTHNHLDSYIPVVATFFVDAIFSAWHHGLTLYSARRYMKKFTPTVIFTCETAADVLSEAAKLEKLNVKLVVFGKHAMAQSLDEISESQTSEEVEKFVVVNEKSPRDVAAVLLSSGSTGFSKGVMLSNISLVAMTTVRQRYHSPTLKLLWYSTLDWLSCLNFVLKTLLKRNTRIITSKIDVESFFQIVQNHKVDVVAFLPPVLVNYVAKSELARNYDLRSLRTAILAGCKYSKKILKGVQQNVPTAIIYYIYGSTETGAISTTVPETKSIESTGFVFANCQVKFVDLTSGAVLGPNHEGELRVKKPISMIGYYEDAESTRQAYDEEGWYRTGDIGYYDEAGEIFIVHRIKDIMKYRNYQIAPAEIEELLLSHPEVQEAAVVGIPHEVDGDWPTAFIKKMPGSKVTEDDIVNLTSDLEDYKKLRGGIYFIDNLPQTGSGKVVKFELKRLAIVMKNSNQK